MPNFDVPAQYLRANYERDDYLAVMLIYRETGVPKHEFGTAEKIAGPRYQAHLRAANAQGADIYLTVNALKAGATGRTKADVETVRHVFLDLDGGGREAVDRILEADGMPNPHHVLNTSPDKHQVIWSVEGFDREQAERLVRGMAHRFGADQAVWDTARVLRMPGFRNCKYEQPHYVRDVHDRPGERIYRPDDFPVYEAERVPVSNEPRRERMKGNPGSHASQSERDWAYALSALERGESPSSIQAQIETLRQDKPNPHYYAERTVARAVMKYERSVSPAEPTNPEVREPDGMER